eukprot:TRINITY_DN14061_c0_g1_i5.p1 TRINITY_DN14061_c0_g1~~TRINITY_DN14061_c0_g1_i5.p1  ORF type:complete len:138 (+),score=8.86 TRINITY_DN14061_c0_g1_i5:125-538(+)
MWYKEVYESLLDKQLAHQERKIVMEIAFTDYFLGYMLIMWNKGHELNSEYCKDTRNEDIKYKCAYNIIQALLKTYQRIAETYGADQTKWKLDYKSASEYTHMPFSHWLTLRFLFHRISLNEVFLVVHTYREIKIQSK